MTLRRGLALGPQIDAFLAAIGGPGGEAVLVPDFRTLAARGSLAGAPVLAGGSGRTLTLAGFTPGAPGVLLPGDLIQAAPGPALTWCWPRSMPRATARRRCRWRRGCAPRSRPARW